MRGVGELMRCETKTVTALAVAGLVALSSACSKTETSISAPSAAAERCDLTATPNPASFPPPGGQGSLTITTARDCTWSVASDATWVTIAGDHNGQGEATVAYSVAANPVPSARSAAIVVGKKSVAVTQQAAPCIFSLSPIGDTISEVGGRLSVSVTTLTGCRWSATSSAAWITVADGQSGNGNGTVALAVAANAGAARVGRVTLAGQTYTVTQAAAPTPTPPLPRTISFSGRISGLSGRCPTVTFSAAGRTISVDRETDFRHSRCDDLKDGRSVSGEGTVQANGSIKATDLEVDQ
jgi:hypothetical protein